MFSWDRLPDRIVIIAHRGASAIAPENTLAAFKEAMKAGADAIEFDVRLTSDGEVVVFHDHRLERTTTGIGTLESCTLSRLKSYSAGSWFHERYLREHVPTLREVVDLVDGKIGLNIELKQDGIVPNIRLLERTIRVIQQYDAQRYVLLSSFNHSLIKRTGEYDNTIITAVLANPLKMLRSSPVQQVKRVSARFYFCSKRSIRKRTTEQLHSHGLFNGVYTVNTSQNLAKMLRFQVDCIFTDAPDVIIPLLFSKNTTFG